MAHILAYPIFRAINNDGTPLVGGKLYTYGAGSSTPQAAYTDKSEGTELTNPVILNSNGEAAIWLGEGKSYKLVLMDANDVTIWTQDNVASINELSVSTAMLKNGALANSTAGRLKMADGYLSASEDGLAKMAAGFFQATEAALAKFANGFFANTDAARAKFAAGFLAASDAGRALMADGFITAAKIADGTIPVSKLVSMASAISSSCGNYSQSGGGTFDVTNLEVTISRTGLPVELSVVADGDTTPTAAGELVIGGTSANPITVKVRILKNGNEIYKTVFGGANIGAGTHYYSFPTSSIRHIDRSNETGNTTYKLQVIVTSGTNSFNFRFSKLLAREVVNG